MSLNCLVKRHILLLHGARCCPNLVHEGRIDVGDLDTHTFGSIAMVGNGIIDLVTELKDILASVSSPKLTFDNDREMSDANNQNLTGLNRMYFEVLCQYASQTMRNTSTRSIRTSGVIIFLKMKSGVPNKTMDTIFNISKASLQKAISSVQNALRTSFVPKHFGFSHINFNAICHF